MANIPVPSSVRVAFIIDAATTSYTLSAPQVYAVVQFINSQQPKYKSIDELLLNNLQGGLLRDLVRQHPAGDDSVGVAKAALAEAQAAFDAAVAAAAAVAS